MHCTCIVLTVTVWYQTVSVDEQASSNEFILVIVLTNYGSFENKLTSKLAVGALCASTETVF